MININIEDETTSSVKSILGNPKSALIKMSIPLIISMLISSLYNVIDAVWLSYLGADVLAAIGYVTPIFMVLVGIGNGLAAGSSSALSKYIGFCDKKRADNGAVHSLIITVITSIFITIILSIFLEDILKIMGASHTIAYALEYGNIIVYSSIIIITSNSVYGMLRGEGDATHAMYAMIIASLLNIALDPILIYVCNLNIMGAALATVISLLFVDVLLFYWYYIKKTTYLKPYPSNYAYDKEITMDIIKVGFPASLELINNALFAAMFSMLLTYVAGTDAVAVYSVGWRIVTIATMPVLAIATALITVMAANYGAKKYENMMIVHRYSMKISIICAVITAVIVFIFAKDIVLLFVTHNSSTHLINSMISFLSVIVFFFPTMAVGAPSTYVFQATGRGITAMFQTIIRESAFTIIMAVILAVYFNMGEFGAWVAIVLGELIANNITLIWADCYLKKLIKYSN